MGKNICIYDGWVDNELISIGDSVMLSLNGSIMTHCIYKDKFIIKKVVIEKNSIIGADALIAPGVFVEEGAIVGASASTVIDQQLDGYVTHVGNPVSRKLPIKISEPQVETPNSE
jgi:acetyltransferase-like isoleucine patch superfamily enzyme